MLKKRILPQNNYKAIHFDGKTLRMRLDTSKPITELEYPEFYDVKITDQCLGRCDYCYQDSIETGRHAINPVEKIYQIFGKMSDNEKPFQVALGGGEPTLHPKFEEILQAFRDLDIIPNYTTNGMFTADYTTIEKVALITKKLVGGVAITTHRHLQRYWKQALDYLLMEGIKTNLHVLISDDRSISDFWYYYGLYKDNIDYFVLLPYTVAGRAEPKEVLTDKILDQVERYGSPENIAFGAMFVEHLDKHKLGKKYSIYDPESMSGYIDLIKGTVHKSSFNMEPKNVALNL